MACKFKLGDRMSSSFGIVTTGAPIGAIEAAMQQHKGLSLNFQRDVLAVCRTEMDDSSWVPGKTVARVFAQRPEMAVRIQNIVTQD